MSASDLPVIGRGPSYRPCKLERAWARKLEALDIGATVDVLLDDGRIVRTTIRAMTRPVDGRCSMWVEGIAGSYAVARVRPEGGWARLMRDP